MKNIINIVGIEKRAGRSKAGNDYDMRMAQCIVERVDPDTGAPAPLVGELVLPEKFKEVPVGRYEVEFEVSVSQDKRIGSVVSSMVAIPATRVASAPAAAAVPPKA